MSDLSDKDRSAGPAGTAEPARRTWWTRTKRVIGWVFRWGLTGLIAFVLVLIWQSWFGIGMRPTGARLTRVLASPQWGEDAFENAAEVTMGDLSGLFDSGEVEIPEEDLSVVETDPALFVAPPTTGLRVTWLGHSTTLLEIDGATFLTDPVWGARTSPVPWLGPERWYAPPLALEDLPELDAVLLSHDHYDHLDHNTIIALIDQTDAPFIMPLGVGAHLEYWGVPDVRIIEVDWWDETEVAGIAITCTPSRHASGRQVLDRDRTLWASYAVVGPEHRVYFSGDSGLFDGFREIGERLGPFDLTMIEIGAYNRAWPDWHLGPEQAVTAHQWLRGRLMMPIHWGLFDLANHSWTEPIERAVVAADDAGVSFARPRPGGTFELDSVPTETWWPDVPWQTAQEHPIRARLVTGMSGE